MSPVSSSKVHLVSCVGVESDLSLLPHFLRYYLDLGVDPGRVHVLLNASAPDAPGLTEAHAILAEYGVEGGEEWIAPYTSDAMWEKRREIQRRVAAPTDWVVSADVDELHEFPAPLGEVLGYCEERGYNCVQGVFIDRLAPGGALAEVEPKPSLWDQFPIEADVICTLRQHEGDDNYRFGTVNVMACRGDVLPSRGGHAPMRGDGSADASFLLGASLGRLPGITDPAVRFGVPFRVHHFKWTDALAERHQRRLDTPGASPAGSAYGRLLLDHLDQWGGRIGIEEMPIRRSGLADRVPWRMRVKALRALAGDNPLATFGLRAARAIKRRVS